MKKILILFLLTVVLNPLFAGTKILEPIESFTGGLLNISTDHKYIHQGKAFEASIETASIAASGTYKIRYKTGTTKYNHSRPTVVYSTANIIKVSFYEGATFSATGTAITVFNKNRISTTTSTAIVAKGATTSANGTLLFSYIVGTGGSPTSRSGGQAAGTVDEYVLKQNTEYCIVVENIGTTTATTGLLNLFWYEEDDG